MEGTNLEVNYEEGETNGAGEEPRGATSADKEKKTISGDAEAIEEVDLRASDLNLFGGGEDLE